MVTVMAKERVRVMTGVIAGETVMAEEMAKAKERVRAEETVRAEEKVMAEERVRVTMVKCMLLLHPSEPT